MVDIDSIIEHYNGLYWWCSSDTMVDIYVIPAIQWLILMIFQQYNGCYWWYSNDTLVEFDGTIKTAMVGIDGIINNCNGWYWLYSSDTMVGIDGIPTIQWLIFTVFQRYNGWYRSEDTMVGQNMLLLFLSTLVFVTARLRVNGSRPVAAHGGVSTRTKAPPAPRFWDLISEYESHTYTLVSASDRSS